MVNIVCSRVGVHNKSEESEYGVSIDTRFWLVEARLGDSLRPGKLKSMQVDINRYRTNYST